MKPMSTNHLSVWGFIGLFILFSMPYIGTPAAILFAIFGHGTARNFARALLILSLIGYVIIFAAAFLGFIQLDFSDFKDFYVDEGIEVFRNVAGFIC